MTRPREPLGGGLRKGAWTKEEDVLLKKCIERYGEGKWRQVPLRAGLKRCRKSCRLRWLNYLSPNIKRGEFSEAEVEIIIKLHNLLGNRWSLIAGRIPGRTANDIKNLWNSHLSKRLANNEAKSKAHVVIKPKARAISIHSNWFKDLRSKVVDVDYPPQEINGSSMPHEAQLQDSTPWWETLLAEVERRGENSASCSRVEPAGMRKEVNGINGGVEWEDWLLDLDVVS